MKNSAAPNVPETFGHSEVKHPYCDCTLSHAVKVAQGIASLNFQTISSLTQARSLIEASMKNCGHVWITGAAALDVLDAAIDGRDIETDNRFGHGSMPVCQPS